MARFATVPTLNVDDAISDAYVDAVTAGVNYLTIAGADLASAAAIAITSEFHKVTGTTTINTINDALGANAGQQIRLWTPSSLTFSASAGNIRTATGADYVTKANEIVVLNYDGALWRVAGPPIGAKLYRVTNGTISGTAAETDIIPASAFTLKGGTIGPTGCIRIKIPVIWNQNTGGTWAPPNIKVYMGATLVNQVGTLGTQASLASGWHGHIECLIQAYDSAHVSSLLETIYAVAGEQNTSAGDGRIGQNINTAAVDLTVDQTVRVTATPATAGGGYSYSYYGGLLEVL